MRETEIMNRRILLVGLVLLASSATHAEPTMHEITRSRLPSSTIRFSESTNATQKVKSQANSQASYRYPITVIDVPYTVDTTEIQVPEGSTLETLRDTQVVKDYGTIRMEYAENVMSEVGIYDVNGDLVAEDSIGRGKKSIRFDAINTARSHPTTGPFLDSSTSLFVYDNISQCPDLPKLETIIRAAKRYVHTPETIDLARKLNKCVVSLLNLHSLSRAYGLRHNVIEVRYIVNTREVQVPEGSRIYSELEVQPSSDHGTIRVEYPDPDIVMKQVFIVDADGDVVAEDSIGAGKKTLRFDAVKTARSYPITGAFFLSTVSPFVQRNVDQCADFQSLVNVIRTQKRFLLTPQTIEISKKLQACITDLYKSKYPTR